MDGFEVWVLTRRGPWSGVETAAIVVRASTEAHARVAAAEKTGEDEWGEGGWACARRLASADVVMFPGGKWFKALDKV